MPATALEQLAEHNQRVADAAKRVQALRRDKDQAQANDAQLAEQRIEAFAADDERAAKAVQSKRTKLAGQIEDLDARLTGAERAAARAQAERDAYIAQNVRALTSERVPAATAAAEALEQWAARGCELLAAWHAVEQETLALLRVVPGVDGRSVPQITEVDQAVRDLARAAGTVPPPLPSDAVPVRQLRKRDVAEAKPKGAVVETFGTAA